MIDNIFTIAARRAKEIKNRGGDSKNLYFEKLLEGAGWDECVKSQKGPAIEAAWKAIKCGCANEAIVCATPVMAVAIARMANWYSKVQRYVPDMLSGVITATFETFFEEAEDDITIITRAAGVNSFDHVDLAILRG